VQNERPDSNGIKLNRIAFLFLVSVILSACQSTGVIPMDHGTYMIGKKDGSPGLGVSLSNKAEVYDSNKAEVYEEANAFCHDKGLEIKTIKVTVLAAKLAKLGSTEMEFKFFKSKT
jgi:hypothetical protein